MQQIMLVTQKPATHLLAKMNLGVTTLSVPHCCCWPALVTHCRQHYIPMTLSHEQVPSLLPQSDGNTSPFTFLRRRVHPFVLVHSQLCWSDVPVLGWNMIIYRLFQLVNLGDLDLGCQEHISTVAIARGPTFRFG